MKSTKIQHGGSHYKTAIEPIEYIMENDLPFCEGNVIKYTSRHASKNGAEDIKKAMHYLQFILEHQYAIEATVEFKSQSNDQNDQSV